MFFLQKSKGVYLAKPWRDGGFSLIEILLVVGISAIIFLFAAPFGMNFYKTQLVNEAQSNIVDALQRARHNAVLQKFDSNWGVRIVAGSYTVFRGNTYDERVDTFDEVYPIISSIEISTSTIIFSKLTGIPSSTSTISITYDTLSRNVILSDTGVVSKD